jgi:hypothetical protein
VKIDPLRVAAVVESRLIFPGRSVGCADATARAIAGHIVDFFKAADRIATNPASSFRKASTSSRVLTVAEPKLGLRSALRLRRRVFFDGTDVVGI